MNDRHVLRVLGAQIDAVSWSAAISTIYVWASNRESRVVCICNVHSVVTATQDAAFGRVVHEADMATPDGAPVAWILRCLGHAGQQRINGPDLMWRYCEARQGMDCRAALEVTDSTSRHREAAGRGDPSWMRQGDGLPRFARNHGAGMDCRAAVIARSESNAAIAMTARVDGSGIFLYGSSEETLAKLKVKLLTAFPALNIAGAISPPFRALSPDEDATIVAQINASGAGVVFVSLGCPKQELWMAAHRGRIHAVMIGVGAAFDYHAGTTKRAPKWMQDCGLEWLHRLVSEPRRLWKRYLVTNTLFVLGAARQLLGVWRVKNFPKVKP